MICDVSENIRLRDKAAAAAFAAETCSARPHALFERKK
jgi:hypothetical protein